MEKIIILVCDQPAILQSLAGRSLVIFPSCNPSWYGSTAEAKAESEKYPLDPLKVTFAEPHDDGTWTVLGNKPLEILPVTK